MLTPVLKVLQFYCRPNDYVLQGHSTNFVNELKLSDFKLVLTRNGIPSEFQMGNLMCGNSSTVQLKR